MKAFKSRKDDEVQSQECEEDQAQASPKYFNLCI